MPRFYYTDPQKKLSEHFSGAEFTCPCCGTLAIADDLILRLEDLRAANENLPVIISSGYRCTARNRAVGGAQNSYHILGLAADIRVLDSADRFRLVQAALSAGFTRLGIYPHHLHVDVGVTPDRVMWFGKGL